MLAHLTGAGIGFASGIFFDDLTTATAIAPVTIMMFLVFGGYLSSESSAGDATSWLVYLSPFYYGYTILTVNELEHLELGDEMLDLLNLDDKDIYTLLWASAVLMVGFRLVDWVILIAKYRNSRWVTLS